MNKFERNHKKMLKTTLFSKSVEGNNQNPSVCPTLPLLAFLKQRIGCLNSSITGLVGLQHLMGSTASLIDTIAENSIAPDNVYLLGKVYSANTRVMSYLKDTRGYYVHPESDQHPESESHDMTMLRKIEDVFETIRQHIEEQRSVFTSRFILIDDGGQAIEMLHQERFSDLIHHFTCVEQTRAGIRAVKELDLRVPVINVAESHVKLNHESPMIGESVKNELFKRLFTLKSQGVCVGNRALIIGYGAIGECTAAELNNCGYEVTVLDSRASHRYKATLDGFRTEKNMHAALPAADLVVGCTGTSVLDKRDHRFIADGAVLVSTSSSDVEFKGWQIRRSPNTKRISSEGMMRTPHPESHPCFNLYKMNQHGKSLYLVNGGFPVNFSGEIDPIPPQMIQLTRGLLYAGAVQASYEQKPGVHSLNTHMQELILNGYAECA